MSNHDEDTRVAVRASADQIDTLLHHFNQPEATWESFGKSDYYLEVMRLHMLEILLCTERELQRRAAVEPTDFGT